MRIRGFILVFLAALLAGCSVQFTPYQRGLSPQQIEALAANRFETHQRERLFVDGIMKAVERRDGDALAGYLAPDLIRGTFDRDVAGFYGQFPTYEPQRVDMVTFRSNLNQDGGGPDTLTLTVEYVFVYEEFAPVFLTITGQAEGASELQAVNVRSQALDPSYWTAPSEIGSVRQTVRVLAIGAPLTLILAFTVWVAVARRLRRRFVWLVVLLATTPTFAFDWAQQDFRLLAPALEKVDGIWRFEAVEWIVTGVQVAKTGDYHPWIVTIGVPLGALWFLIAFLTGQVERRDPAIQRDG